MTVAEWARSSDVWALLNNLGPRASERKSRLFVAMCCDRIRDLMPVEEARHCIDAALAFVDGHLDQEGLASAVEGSMRATEAEWRRRREANEPWGAVEQEAIHAVSRMHRSHGGGRNVACGAAWHVKGLAWRREREGIDPPAVVAQQQELIERGEQAAQAQLLREVHGPPFRDIVFNPSWRTEAVVALASGMYESRDFAAMPVLADALDDAGCGDADILAHCRGAGPHVRGCWVVDLVLGKE